MNRDCIRYIPDVDTEKLLFGERPDFNEMALKLGRETCFDAGGEFKEINWLNTPGPVFTTCTDNCGTGQMEAIHNIGVDEEGREIIFKQPTTLSEVLDVERAAVCDPFAGHFINGNAYWTADKVIEWWGRSQERVDYIIKVYKTELELPDVYPPREGFPAQPVPKNCKIWLNFYRNGMKEYLEWYINKLHEKQIQLPDFVYDWKEKEELDRLILNGRAGGNGSC